MKNTVLSLFLLLLLAGATPPEPVRLYLDEHEQETTQEQAVVVRTIGVNTTHRIVTDHTPEGLPLHYGEYALHDPQPEDGRFMIYESPGKLYAQGHYDKGRLQGQWVYYDEGNRADTVDYDFELPDCTVTEHPRGQMDQKQEGNFYRGLNEYFAAHFRLPPRQRHNDHFVVAVDFIVGSDGRLHCIEFTRPLDEDLRTEALRVLQAYHNPHAPKREVRRPFTYAVGSGHWDDEVVYTVIEDMPHLSIPGYDSFRQYVDAALIYPPDALDRGITGTVILNFVVEPDGSIHDIMVLKGVDASLDREAMRVVATSPRWVPGRQRGVPLRVGFNMPVRFGM